MVQETWHFETLWRKEKNTDFFIFDVQVHNKALDGLAECKSYVMLLHKRDCLNEEVIQKYDMGVDGIE